MKRTIWFWLAAVVLTLAAAFFQRHTGPTYPKTVSAQIDDTTTVNVTFLRSYNIDKELRVELPPLSWDWTARLYHRPYPVDTAWTLNPPFWPEEGAFVSYLPPVSQKAAKLEYYVELENSFDGKKLILPEDNPIVIRYKGSVPAWALIPHIILMFVALIFSNLAGFMAFFNHNRFKFWGLMAIIFIFFGGLVFGPIVQKFAFDHYWTGFPMGSDLTDNKTLIMFVVWVVAVIANWKKEYRWVTLAASVVTIVVYLIPHSMRGSEFNYETGEIGTGFISFISTLL
jgi:hypothetical protein